MIEVRQENESDYERVRMINDMAFAQPVEGKIVDSIRKACDKTLSLVALKDGELVGHIFFSPVLVKNNGQEIAGMGLAPMAVLPGFQRQGIGTSLVKQGIEFLRTSNCPFVVVLGHPEYYPRFGFEIASKYGLVPQWDDIPEEAFMVLFLDESAAINISGTAFYRDEFADAC